MDYAERQAERTAQTYACKPANRPAAVLQLPTASLTPSSVLRLASIATLECTAASWKHTDTISKWTLAVSVSPRVNMPSA
jgi:hypothetical protein